MKLFPSNHSMRKALWGLTSKLLFRCLTGEEDTSGTLFEVIDRLEIALDTLDNDPGYGMIDDRDQLDEAHGLSKADAKTLKDFVKDQKGDIKRIINFLVKSNVEVDKTQDVTKMKKEGTQKVKISKEHRLEQVYQGRA